MFTQKRRGFVLAELMVVLVATGVAAALAAPRLQKSVDRSRIRTATTVIENAVLNAKIVAAHRGCPAFVHLGSGPDARISVTTCTRSGTGVDTVKTNQVGSTDLILSTTVDSVAFTSVGTRASRETAVVKFFDEAGVVADSVIISPVGNVNRK